MAGGALKCQARDEWIGWVPVLQYQRLHLIAKNTRFLILPEIRMANLASRVLSLNLRRLSRDWEAVHGHPVLLAETFVDISRFAGGCYRAANWIAVGQTLGYGKSGRRYWWHGQPKQMWVYPLYRRARQWLCEPISHSQWRCGMSHRVLSAKQMEDLYERRGVWQIVGSKEGSIFCHGFNDLLGSHSQRGTQLHGHRGVGRETYAEPTERLRARRHPETRRYEAPSEPTIRRVLQKADAERVDRVLGEWLSMHPRSKRWDCDRWEDIKRSTSFERNPGPPLKCFSASTRRSRWPSGRSMRRRTKFLS